MQVPSGSVTRRKARRIGRLFGRVADAGNSIAGNEMNAHDTGNPIVHIVRTNVGDNVVDVCKPSLQLRLVQNIRNSALSQHNAAKSESGNDVLDAAATPPGHLQGICAKTRLS